LFCLFGRYGKLVFDRPALFGSEPIETEGGFRTEDDAMTTLDAEVVKLRKCLRVATFGIHPDHPGRALRHTCAVSIALLTVHVDREPHIHLTMVVINELIELAYA